MDYRKSQETNNNPPPYPYTTEDAPSYDPPTFHGDAPGSTQLAAATARYPPTLNLYYQWKLKQVYYLGPSSEKKLHAVSLDSKLFSRKQTLLFHDGPTDKAPVLATATRSVSGWSDKATITIRRSDGSDAEILVHRPADSGFMKSATRNFTISTPKGAVEEFQWRTTHGNEIKELAGRSYGWKLIRLSGGQAAPQQKKPDLGFTSDGKEVVAVLAQNMSWSMTKGYRFAFMGSGLTGVFGEDWETAAVFSGFLLWWIAQTDAAAAGSAAGAGAGSAAC
ncbi:hypothetical protein CMUS01_12727 [Colletotrichum musicola]|uniref:Uncharacterized protein n=1 Tax=Colletotrichum musicola TaxID=2175873 RepID=A0A8H6JJ75_9PEZI|nr:hypothetical protein CMUS01_12727 [Colletotrichum musicola]